MKQFLLSIIFIFLSGILFPGFTGGKKELPGIAERQVEIKSIKSVKDWQKERSMVILAMQEAMGKLPERSKKNDFDLIVTDSVSRGDHYRLTVNFLAADNERVYAYLYLPLITVPGQKFPAMLALHGTGPLGKKYTDGETTKPNRAYAKELAQRGYVVIAPDYPSMGEAANHNFETDRYESGTMKGIFNHIRCVDLLQSLACVDTAKIGVIGHSLGGHNAIFTGAFDKRLKVVVSSCGWTLMDYYDIGEAAITKYGHRLGPWAQDRYMPLLRTKFNLDPQKIPFDFDGVIAAIAPRYFFSNSPVGDSNFDVNGVKEGIVRITEIYRLFKAKDHLRVIYPDAAHDFPPEAREEAYRFIDQALRRKN
ncbi:MAG: alpha/beta fold hydrolase [Prolixibacteraceae bacterium]|jgi:acetyl esterase/lipase|nr:alpha/beta fold hydrolase [Prolixibacteraceae bacterium]